MDFATFTIEINERFTRIADLKSNGDLLEMQALGYKDTVPYFFSTENDQLIDKQAQMIEELVSHLRIRKKNVNIIIPDAYTFSQIIEMPELKEKELLAAIRYQADEFIPMPIEDTVLDIEVLSQNPKTKKLLIFIVACPKKIIEQVKKTVEKAHLIPENMENELSAAGRLTSLLFKKGTTTAGTASIVVNFGNTQSSLYLFDNTSGLIIMARTFKLGLELFVREVKINMSLDDQRAFEAIRNSAAQSQTILPIINPGLKEFGQEVERFMLLAREHHNVTISNIYMYNFDVFCPLLGQTMKSKFTIPLESLPIGNLLAKNSISTSFATYMSSFVSVIGGILE